MIRCGYKWQAPHLLAPNAPREVVAGKTTIPVRGDRIYVEQECVLCEGHSGPHRSMHNVLASNRESEAE